MNHAGRSCAYRNASAGCRRGRITKAEYSNQRALYRSANFPADQGLYVNTMMVRRLGDAATDRFNKAWFNHFIQVFLPGSNLASLAVASRMITR
jgi:hypothetical protein